VVEGRVECDAPAHGRPWSRSPPLAVVDGDLKDHLEATLDPAAVAEPSPTGGTGDRTFEFVTLAVLRT